MTSLWLDRNTPLAEHGATYPASDFAPGAEYDAVVVGAGLTGLVTALLLVRAGKRVAVIDAIGVGGLATGNTTAKLSLLQGARYSAMLAKTARKNAAAYVESNREGFEWLLRYLDDHSVPYQRRDAYTYAGTPEGAADVDREHLAARRLGLPVEKVTALELPFPAFGAVRLSDQAQFDPMDVLRAMAADVRSRGGTLVEGVRVTRVRAGGSDRPSVVVTTEGDVLAAQVVLATGMPFLDRGLYFAKLEPSRSYALAFRVPAGEVAPDFGMYLSLDAPGRSLRTTPVVPADLPSALHGADILIVGGNGHRVGAHPHPRDLVTDLETWTLAHFPGAERTHAWSAQDYRSADRIPFIGRLPRSRRRVYLATGFDKWGMANAVAAGIRISAEILGGHLPWAKVIGRRVTRPGGFATGARVNLEVGALAVTGWARAEAAREPAPPSEGRGVVGSAGAKPVGVCTVGGVSRRVSAVCPHLGGVVTWNDQELSWDCPLHGSRFRADGTRIEGPATEDLAPA
ncbi:MAG: dependent oxidoreductase [Naasia sp.]|uniref:FAD-dependent oxidoreductase n=1 Tax=Naasia sp. TaxID=2546198 RepID=UPI002607B6A2|nr:FAD-dependent oxidoreductase [Naasia sp.]MCU1571357.1 dependent oxidoreductase [Naasia sp.]